MLTMLIGVLEQGVIYGIMALGLCISYKILNFPDLTVDGSFPLGAAVSAALIALGVNPWLALLASFVAGGLAGLLTGLLHVKLKITDLLAGIIMMTGLYSVNYRIVGKANAPLFNNALLFNSGPVKLLSDCFPPIAPYATLICLILIVVLCKVLLDLYLKTKSGMLLIAAGDNAALVTSLAKNPGTVKILGLALANGLVALSGAVACNYNRTFDVTMGVGTMVTGLASVVIGVTIFRKVKFMKMTTMAIIGCIIYKGCVMLALNLGMESFDMKLIIAVLFVLTLIINKFVTRRDSVA